MNGVIRWRISGVRANLVPRQPVVGEDLPRGGRAAEGMGLGLPVVLEPEGRQADARALGLRPAAAEQIRAAGRAERLRRTALGGIRAQQLLALEEPDRARRRSSAHGSVPTGDALAELA